jgi:hypothetical protein
LLISLGVEQFLRQTFVTMIHAWVKSENEASLHAFTKAGFVVQDLQVVKEQQCVHLRWENNGQ